MQQALPGASRATYRPERIRLLRTSGPPDSVRSHNLPAARFRTPRRPASGRNAGRIAVVDRQSDVRQLGTGLAPWPQGMSTPTRWVAIIGGVCGLFGCLAGLWIPTKAVLAQVLIGRAWERARAGEAERRPWPWADTRPIARLIAPEHERTLYVLAGASGQSLAFGPAHVSSTAAPGERDNIAIAGHRDTHFAFLRDLEAGDTLVLETLDRALRYRVTGMEVVHESHTELLWRSGRAELTLITCYPFDAITPGGPLRYVVHATGILHPRIGHWSRSGTNFDEEARRPTAVSTRIPRARSQ